MITSTVDTKLKNRFRSPFIVDTTLRDGEQHPGLVLTLEEKSIILSRLLDMGLREFEIGIPAMGEDVQKEIRVLQRIGQRRGARMVCWSRCTLGDIADCESVDAAAIHLSIPVSDLQMKIIGMNRTETLDRLNRCLDYAKERFDFISVGAQDATRADRDFLMQYMDMAAQMGAKRVRIADTVGCTGPIEVHQLVTQMTAAFPGVELEFHAHNDFGMATANAIAAIQGGAHCVSTTLIGIGERAGNTPFEVFVAAMKEILQIDLGLDTKALYPLCRYFSKTTGIPISATHPVVGEKVLTHESGIHTHGQLHHPKAYQPIIAEEVGRHQPDFVFGSHTGKTAVKHLMAERNIRNCSDAVADIVSKQIKRLARNGTPTVSPREVIALVEKSQRECG